MELKKVKVSDIVPYINNPRNNDGAVGAVVESIKQCGYITPIIVDENMVILAGHTRHKAIQRLGWQECTVAVASGLNEEQKRKYRLLDNKTNEFATWDFAALEQELEGLDFGDFDFGFNVDDVEGLFEAEQHIKEEAEKDEYPKQIIVTAADPAEQEDIERVLHEHEFPFEVK